MTPHTTIISAKDWQAYDPNEAESEGPSELTRAMHDLRNALCTTLLSAQALQRRSGGADDPVLLRMIRSLFRLKHGMEDVLLGLGTRERGCTRTRALLELSIREIVDAAVEEMSWVAQTKGVSIVVGGEAQARGDRRLVISAITNLLGNAVKYTHAQGTIQIRISEDVDAASVEIEDECGGLPEGRVEELFSPFVQRSRDRSGFGLGLAITKGIVKAHRGTLQVWNVPGKGCTFRASLPR